MTQRIENVPPLDDLKWMRNDVLFGNYDVVTQDVNSKMQDVILCLRSLNGLYQLLRAMLGEVVVDDHRRLNLALAQFPVWTRQDFEMTIQKIDDYLEDLRVDGILATQLFGQAQEGQSFARCREQALKLSEKFVDGGVHPGMDENRTRWIKGLSYSLQVWSDILNQRLNKCIALFDDVTELVFLTDRAFPFILDQLRILAEDNKQDSRRADELLSDWKDCSLFATGLELKLNRLDAKLQPKWVEGCKEIRRLLEDLLRLKRLIGFLWGEATAKRIFKRLSSRVADLEAEIKQYGNSQRAVLEKKQMQELAEKVFNIVVDR